MRRTTIPITIALLGLTGCGGGILAPEGPATNAFLDQVSSNCGKLKIGNQPIDFLLDVNSNDGYFVDETSKLSTGSIAEATYADDINAFYPTGTNQVALDCIFNQLD
jgi:hypothetical protein